MSDFKPTPSQEAAIKTKGRAVLVSAAAGSGKTKVLTERLLARITCDADIDSFLIITFTKAAAAELRSRISGEIAARLAEDPTNSRLRRQSALCQKAQIGTIHSFCSAVLRENCHAAGLSPEFRVIEEDRAEMIKARVIDRVMEAQYENMSDDFRLLADTIGSGRNDAGLVRLVLALHRKMQSHARPDEWAQEQMEAYALGSDDPADTPWGREIMKTAKSSAAHWAAQMDKLCEEAHADEKIEKAYGESLAESALSLRELSRALEGGWERAREFLPVRFPNLKSCRSENAELKQHIKDVREACKESCRELFEYMSESGEKLMSDLRATAPAMRALLQLTLDFDRAYSAEKRRRSELDFNDLEHLTARLLTESDGRPTALARELSGRYTEIMVDEYQDVNRVQDAIFRAVSKNGENLFMVGDVKQSIYRFRLADPTIFTDKYEQYADLAAAGGSEPVRILLQENFRSRAEVINGANHVFRTCMSKALGEIDYDKNAELKCGAVGYAGSVPVPELMLLELGSVDSENDDKTSAEAAMVASKIRELIDSGVTVSDHGETRPLRCSDIAILMRSANSVGDVYRRALTEAGIPVMNGQGGAFFSSTEISTLICLLAVIDNPHQDIPLIAVLRSPLFGFTADELSQIRAEDKKCDFYTALQKHGETDEKTAAFLHQLSGLRSRAADTEPGEFIWHIYDETDMVSVCSAMRGGEDRCRNLTLMPDYAKRFEATGYRGLHRFVEWLNDLAERGEEPRKGVSGNAVQIMTVHKSKGLEFPVVFLCDTARRFNRQDMQEKVIMHPRLGLGARVIDPDRGISYPSLAYNAVKLVSEREMLSEEMRLLYVALTRAKERLFITAGLSKIKEKRQETLSTATVPASPEILLAAQYPAKWLLYAALTDKNGAMVISEHEADYTEWAVSDEKAAAKGEVDPELVEKLRHNLGYAYPHAAATALPSKLTATELKHTLEPDEEAVSLMPTRSHTFRSPELLCGEKPLSGAEKGTATHMVLQFMDYSAARSIESIKNEISRLREGKFISRRQAEAVDAEAIRRLFASNIGRRILSADKVTREFKFSLLQPAEHYFDGGAGESVLLQGVIDCFIEKDGDLTVIDYKTDRVKGEALKARAASYASQVRAYAEAIERITGKHVTECVLYFLYADEAVTVKM